MALTRRNFFGASGAGLLAVVGGSILNTGCWFSQNVFNAILQYVGLGLQAFTSVLNILIGGGVISPTEGSAISILISMIKAGFADLQVAVTAYNNAPAADKATLEGKIATAIAVIENNLNQFWSDLHIPDASLAALIQGLLGIILSTLAGFATQLPAPLVAKQATAKGLVVAPQKRTPKEFKRDFNALLVGSKYGQFKVK